MTLFCFFFIFKKLNFILKNILLCSIIFLFVLFKFFFQSTNFEIYFEIYSFIDFSKEIYFNFLLKSSIYLLETYFIESIIISNLIILLSLHIKMFLKEEFWLIKKFQKKEMFFFKNLIFFCILNIFFNIILLQYNININTFFFEKNNLFVLFTNTLTFFSTFHFFFFNNFNTLFFKSFLIFFFVFILIMYWQDIKTLNKNTYKNIFIFYILLNFLFIFSLFFISCFDFFIFFILLIGINISIYSLLIFDNSSKISREATIKYFISSTVGTLFILGGISLIFLIYKTTNFFIIHSIISQNQNIILEEKLKLYNKIIFFTITIFQKPIIHLINNNSFEEILNFVNFLWSFNNFLIIIFILLGIFFKLSIFPLHSWSIEIYNAIKFRLIAIFILILKLIFFLKIIQIFFFIFQIHKETTLYIKNILIIVSIISIIYGSFASLFEDKLKKIIAYSSINQFGFILLSLGSSSYSINQNFQNNFWNVIEGVQASIFFIIIYLLSNLILIWFVHKISLKKKTIFIKDLAQTPILLVIPILIMILSFSGLPPLAGFFSKFFILYICWKNNFFFLVFLVLITSIFSNYLYLKIIKNIIFDKNTNLSFTKNENVIFIKKKKEYCIIFTDIFLFIISIYFILFFFFLKNILYLSFILSINTFFII